MISETSFAAKMYFLIDAERKNSNVFQLEAEQLRSGSWLAGVG